MIVQFLGLMDIFAGAILLLLKFGVGETIGMGIGLYLLAKGIVFIYDAVSVMDILAGIVMILAVMGHYYFFDWVFVLWLLQKGFFSFFS